MKKLCIVVLVIFAAIVFIILPQAEAKKKIRVSELPKSIVEAVEKLFPGAVIYKAKKVDDNGEYDVYTTLPDSRKCRIDFNDWKVEKIKEEFTKKSLHEAIMEKSKKASPTCIFRKANREIKKAKKKNSIDKGTYEVEIKTDKGDKNKYFFNLAMEMVDSIEKMSLKDLPTAVKKSIKKSLPGSTIKKATKRSRHEKVFYELEIINANRSRIKWTVPAE